MVVVIEWLLNDVLNKWVVY